MTSRIPRFLSEGSPADYTTLVIVVMVMSRSHPFWSEGIPDGYRPHGMIDQVLPRTNVPGFLTSPRATIPSKPSRYTVNG